MGIVIAILLAVVVGILVKLIFFPSRGYNEPPCIRGWIPWIGAAFQFGRAPLELIEEARCKVILVWEGKGGGMMGKMREALLPLAGLLFLLPVFCAIRLLSIN